MWVLGRCGTEMQNFLPSDNHFQSIIQTAAMFAEFGGMGNGDVN